jgi:hypothetical protein
METWGELERMVDAGLVRHIGTEGVASGLRELTSQPGGWKFLRGQCTKYRSRCFRRRSARVFRTEILARSGACMSFQSLEVIQRSCRATAVYPAVPENDDASTPPNKASFPYTAAQSMWRWPRPMATWTASATSACPTLSEPKVPSHRGGIAAPEAGRKRVRGSRAVMTFPIDDHCGDAGPALQQELPLAADLTVCGASFQASGPGHKYLG